MASDQLINARESWLGSFAANLSIGNLPSRDEPQLEFEFKVLNPNLVAPVRTTFIIQ